MVRYLGSLTGETGQWVGVEVPEDTIPAEAKKLSWNEGKRGEGKHWLVLIEYFSKLTVVFYSQSNTSHSLLPRLLLRLHLYLRLRILLLHLPILRLDHLSLAAIRYNLLGQVDNLDEDRVPLNLLLRLDPQRACSSDQTRFVPSSFASKAFVES